MKRAEKRKYHFIYKTSCIATDRWYIGMHSTDDLDDGYLGSGKLILRSIHKYGKENHTREILEMYSDRKTLVAREKELINTILLSEEKCMNLALGGEGGFSLEACILGGKIGGRLNGPKTCQANIKKAHERHRTDLELKEKMKIVCSENGKKTGPITGPITIKIIHELMKNDPEFAAKRNKNSKAGVQRYWDSIPLDSDKRKLSEEQKIKQSVTAKERKINAGEKNGNFGKCWIFYEVEQISKLIQKSDLEYWQTLNWNLGRKLYENSPLSETLL